jgi:hypothetical protein
MYTIIKQNCAGKKAEVIQNHENVHFCSIGQGDASHKNIRSLNLAMIKLTTVQVTKLPLQHKIWKIGMI